jgi:hypothetical protein
MGFERTALTSQKRKKIHQQAIIMRLEIAVIGWMSVRLKAIP